MARSRRYVFSVRPQDNPPAWWPRDAAGALAYVYTNDGTDWQVPPPQSWRLTVIEADIPGVIAAWHEYYKAKGRTWEFRVEQWRSAAISAN